MSLRTSLAGGVMSFAHLAGIRPGKSAKTGKSVAEDDDKDPAAEDDDEDKPEASDDEDKPAAEEDDKDPAAEDDDEDKPEASDDGDEDDEEEAPKTRKAKGRTAKPVTAEFKRGRASERRRCAAIFASPSASRNTALAAHLAFNTGMASSAAIQILKDTPVADPRGAGRSDNNPRIGPDGGRPDHAKAVAGSWDAAHAKVPGVKRAQR